MTDFMVGGFLKKTLAEVRALPLAEYYGWVRLIRDGTWSKIPN